MKLILIRHGQTEWNTQMRTQGRSDIPLDETGVLQGERVAQRLKSQSIQAVYASPLARAAHTAEAIARHHELKVNLTPLLIERDFGAWEGFPFSELRVLYPELMKLWQTDPMHCTPPGAEPLSSVVERCETLLQQIRLGHMQEDTIAIVAHSVPLRVLISGAIGLPYTRLHSIGLDNVSISVLKMHEKYNMLTVLNDTAHLEVPL